MYGLLSRSYGLGASNPPPAIQTALQTASAQYGVPYFLLASVAHRESGFNPNAVGGAGEQGLMQIMPANDASLGLSNPFDPNANAAAGAKLLSQLYGQYGDWGTALIAYNEGPGNLASRGVFPASQAYANAILADQSSYVSPDAIGGDTEPILDSSGGGGDGSGGGISSGAVVGLAAAGLGLLFLALR